MLNTIITFMLISGSLFDLIPFIDPPHWNPSWPIFKDNPQFMPVWKGYGDWCPPSQGPHGGIDFDASAITDSVLAPNDFDAYSGDIYIDPFNPDPGYMMCFLESLDDDYGWGLGHLKILDPYEPQFLLGNPITAKRPMAPAQPPTGAHIWRHVHFAWVPKLDPDPTTNLIGLFNPFDYLQAPAGYDETGFWHIPHVDNGSHCGMWFTLDQIEEPGNFPGGLSALKDFQNRIYGVVDIVARPYSHPVGSPFETNCGVRSVSHNILKQNPYNGSYDPLPDDIYGARTLVSFDGLIPYGPSPYYDALFFDPKGTGSTDWDWSFGTSYIVTNCGKGSIGSNGFDNIWTGNMTHDWRVSPQKLNQGGWDTRLRSPFMGGSANLEKAYINEHAAFPDGRYAVEITAVSQGDSIVSLDTLPSTDVWNPAATVQGIVVDNYRPHVDSVDVYQCPENIILYSAGWITDYESPLDTIRLYDEIDNWSYLAQDTSHTLFVYVYYSEPIDSSFQGDVWLTAGNQSEIIWSSLDSDGTNSLSPIPLMNSTHSVSPVVSRETDNGSYYVGYESNVPFPGRYAGELILHISGPRDLSGNRIDADPSTVAHPRDRRGYFPSAGYETGVDSSYSWGVPRYWAMPGAPYDDYVVGKKYNGGASISGTGMYLDSLHLQGRRVPCTCGPSTGHDSRKGWCPYWAGFWLSKDPWGVTDSIYIVKPVTGEGIYNGWDKIIFDLPIPYEMHYCGPTIPYPHSQCRGCISTYTGNHCFVGWSNKLDHSSPYVSFITCIDAISESIADPLYLGTGGISGIYGGAGDTVQVHYGGDILYFTPEDFFPEEKNNCYDSRAYEAIEDEPGAVYDFSLAVPNPNPFAVSSVFTYTLASSGTASLDVYDVSGRLVRNLVSGEHLSGAHSVTWAGDDSNGTPIPGGIYLLRLCSGEETAVRSCVVIR
ncbi:MAG: hypothetical protein K8S15_12690 [Candidatus Aegiribacteria sp.]|nr:hypothetical protein [Candidatus Aegiribacteria sp.]